jgi:hypothetical protein
LSWPWRSLAGRNCVPWRFWRTAFALFNVRFSGEWNNANLALTYPCCRGIMYSNFRTMSKWNQRRPMAAALFLVAVWLLLLAAEASQPFHIWLHGGKIPNNDDCGVALVHHGQVDTSATAVTASLPPAVMIVCVPTPSRIFPSVGSLLPSSRAPPAGRL